MNPNLLCEPNLSLGLTLEKDFVQKSKLELIIWLSITASYRHMVGRRQPSNHTLRHRLWRLAAGQLQTGTVEHLFNWDPTPGRRG